MSAFKDILNTRGDETRIPDPLPIGHYAGVLRSYKLDETKPKPGSGKTPSQLIRFLFGATRPLADVDPDELEAYESAGGIITEEELRFDQFVTPKALPYTVAFLVDKMGCNKNQTVQEMLEAAQGSECRFFVKHEISQRTGRPYSIIDSFLSVDDGDPGASDE